MCASARRRVFDPADRMFCSVFKALQCKCVCLVCCGGKERGSSVVRICVGERICIDAAYGPVVNVQLAAHWLLLYERGDRGTIVTHGWHTAVAALVECIGIFLPPSFYGENKQALPGMIRTMYIKSWALCTPFSRARSILYPLPRVRQFWKSDLAGTEERDDEESKSKSCQQMESPAQKQHEANKGTGKQTTLLYFRCENNDENDKWEGRKEFDRPYPRGQRPRHENAHSHLQEDEIACRLVM
jgi:hypothetical protein